MTEEFIAPHQSQDGLEEHLEQVQALLARQKLVEELVHRQGGPRQDLVENLVHKQNLAELQKKLDDAGKQFQSIASSQVPAINTALQSKNQEPLKAATREDWDKKQK